MILPVLTSLLFSKIKRRNIKPLFYCWSFYPVLVVQVILVVLQCAILAGDQRAISYLPALEPFIILSFLFGIFSFRIYKPAVAGACCVIAGTALNRFAIVQNGGKMPVFPSLSRWLGVFDAQAFGVVDQLHILGDETTKVKFLTDYIDLGYSILSPGDILIQMFVVLMLYYMIKYANVHDKAAHVRMN